MREHVRGAGLCLMLCSMLHSIATGNLLPASVHTVCVDINPAVVTKLADRGSFQTIGIVTDVGLFLDELVSELEGRHERGKQGRRVARRRKRRAPQHRADQEASTGSWAAS